MKIIFPFRVAFVAFTAPFMCYVTFAWLSLVLIPVRAAMNGTAMKMDASDATDKIIMGFWILFAAFGITGYLRWVGTISPHGYTNLANRKTGIFLALGLAAAAPLLYALSLLPLNLMTSYLFSAYIVVILMMIEVLLPNSSFKRDALKRAP